MMLDIIANWQHCDLVLNPLHQFEFQVRGRAGNNLALTTFWRQLQASPFIRNVQLVQTDQVVEPTGQLVYEFQLDCVYAPPPMDFLETVPLFDDPMTVNE